MPIINVAIPSSQTANITSGDDATPGGRADKNFTIGERFAPNMNDLNPNDRSVRAEGTV